MNHKKNIQKIEEEFANGQHIQAIESSLDLTRKFPEVFDYLNLSAILFAKIGEFQKSYELFEGLVNESSPNASYFYNFVNLLIRINSLDKAIDIMYKAVSLKPQEQKYQRDMGVLLLKAGQIDKSIKFLRNAVSMDQNDYDSRFSLSTALLRAGKLSEGWKLYESRFVSSLHKRKFQVAVKAIYEKRINKYDGQDLTNKALLIHDEQGFGDFIQFIRYANSLKEKYSGLSLIVVCKKPLKKLIERAKLVDYVFTYEDQHQIDNSKFDYWDFILSLPRYFEKDYLSIASKDSYINYEFDEISQLKKLLSRTKLNIGLNHKGNKDHANDSYRSIRDLSLFNEIVSLNNCNFFYIGTDDISIELNQLNLSIHQCNGFISNFHDSYRIVKKMDLIISVDTSLVHLAAAAGVKCFLMLPKISTDWRWGNDLSYSPWYETIEVFKQNKYMDWSGVLQNIYNRISTMKKST